MKLVMLILPILLFLASFVTAQALGRFPLKELRQKNRVSGDKSTAQIYRLAQYGATAKFLLWLIAGMSLADILFRAFKHDWWLGVLVVLVSSGLMNLWQPVKNTGGWAWQLAGFESGILAYLLSYIKGVSQSFNNFAARWHYDESAVAAAGGLYEKNDLVNLLKRQPHQADNRIDPADLDRAISALEFSDKKAAGLMTPVKGLRQVEASEPISPLIMDELHKTGAVRFPVVQKASKIAPAEVLGSLYIGDLLEKLDEKGKLGDLMDSRLAYVREDYGLSQVVEACLKTGSNFVIVLSPSDQITGYISAEDVLQQLLGTKPDSGFESYNERHTVAAHEPK